MKIRKHISRFHSNTGTTDAAPQLPVDLTVRNFRLSHIRLADVLPLTKIFVDSNGGGNVVDYPGNNSLVVSGSAAIMGALSEFITSSEVSARSSALHNRHDLRTDDSKAYYWLSITRL